MASLAKIARRTFLVAAGASAAGLAVGYYFYRQPFDNPLHATLDEGEETFNPYVTIAPDNTITIYNPRSEMGQGVMTTLVALVAEELDVRLEDVQVEHAPAAAAYANIAMMEEGLPFPVFDRSTLAQLARSGTAVVGKFLALQVTGGSSSTIDAFEKMRMAGATTRESLKAAAAKRWGVAASLLITEDGMVRDPSGTHSASYGALAAEAAFIPIEEVELRKATEWKILGKSQPRKDMLAKVTGAPIFGVDVRQPDMLHATVRMNPRLGGALGSLDTSAAEAMPGVVKIIEMDQHLGKGYAVIADNTWRAFQAADAVVADWGPADYPGDSASIWTLFQQAMDGEKASHARDDGDVEIAFADAPRQRVVEAEYSVPYLAHTTMEPMNATAQFKDGKLTIWAPSQAPNLVQSLAADAIGIKAEDCTVHTTYLGGGFGRRGDIDYAIQAALVAAQADGRPVKVTWTREEDVTHDMYRPAALGRFRARLDADGYPQAVDMRIATPSVMASVLGRYYPNIIPFGPDKTMTDGAFNQPYRIDNYRVSGVKVPVSVPVGFWRSVGNSFNGYFHECFMDEIAAAGGLDPLAMRRRLMADFPVAVALVDKVAEMSDWGAPMPERHARGMAFTLSFGTWVAQVVEVSQEEDDGAIRIEKVWCAADPGIVLDPSIFEAQMVSGIVYGLSSALGQEITFSDGMVDQSNFHDYDAMRINQCPDIEVAILTNSDHMGGAGEPSTPPSIPALANAVFALTGKRIRQMPLSKEVSFA